MRDICFLLNDLASGGAERVTSILANDLALRGYNVTIVLLRDEVSYYVRSDVHIVVLKTTIGTLKAKRIWSYVMQLKQLAHKLNRPVFIAMLNSVLHYAVIASIIAPVRVIACERNDPYQQYKSRWSRFLRRQFFRLSDYAVFQTDSAKSFYPDVVQRRSRTIPNPVIIPSLIWTYSQANSDTIICVCRLERQKNIPMLLKAMKIVVKQRPQTKLNIYGHGSESSELEKFCEELGLTSNVNFCGTTQNVTSALSESAVFVSSSDFEGISNSILEALAFGIPVVATDCPGGGTASMIKSGENGLLTPVGDHNSLAAAIISLLNDPVRAKKMGMNARESCKAFSLEVISSKWINIIES